MMHQVYDFIESFRDINPSLINTIIEGLSIIESVNPVMPKGVKYKSKIINRGTNTAFENKYASFVTKSGNKVNVNLFSGELSFDVNDSRKESDRDRDVDILPNVLAVATKMLDKYKINDLKISADTDEGDYSYVKDLPYKEIEDKLTNTLRSTLEYLDTLDFSHIQPTENQINFAKKFNKPIEVDSFLRWSKRGLQWALDNMDDVENVKLLYDRLYNIQDDLLRSGVNKNEINNILNLSKSYVRAKLSNIDKDGFKDYRNRRYAIYKRLVPKYFGNDWEVSFDDIYHIIHLHRKSML